MAHDTAEYIVKVLPGIDIARLAGLDEAEEQCRGRAPRSLPAKSQFFRLCGAQHNGNTSFFMQRWGLMISKVASTALADAALPRPRRSTANLGFYGPTAAIRCTGVHMPSSY